MNGPARTKWKYTEKAKEFHAAHAYSPYMMMWIPVVEAEMRDSNLPKQNRVLAAIRRYSWGHFSIYAMDRMPQVDPGDPEPQPLTQEGLARILKLSPSLVSEAVALLKKQGYLRADSSFLYPDDKIQPSLFASLNTPPSDIKTSESDSVLPEPDSSSLPSFSDFRTSYLTDHEEFAEVYGEMLTEKETAKATLREPAGNPLDGPENPECVP
jgi:hypothetical protein